MDEVGGRVRWWDGGPLRWARQMRNWDDPWFVPYRAAHPESWVDVVTSTGQVRVGQGVAIHQDEGWPVVAVASEDFALAACIQGADGSRRPDVVFWSGRKPPPADLGERARHAAPGRTRTEWSTPVPGGLWRLGSVPGEAGSPDKQEGSAVRIPEPEEFRSILHGLPHERRAEVMRLAFKARPASDPETAALVVGLVRYWSREFREQPVPMIGLIRLVFERRYRRAERVNLPVVEGADRPGEEGRGAHGPPA